MVSFIALEEHYVSPVVREGKLADYTQFPPQLVSKLESLGDARIQDMDNGNVSVQVLSHGPGHFSPATCSSVNDDLASAISQNPTRLQGFAMLPMSHPDDASKELERCITKLGFVGALIENHENGQFYDDERFWTVFKKAQGLDVPIYIHPSFASEQMMERYEGNYDKSVALALSAFGWGWHSETGLHILKLFAAGLFDCVPKVKIVIGHMGEMLPFQLERVIRVAARFGRDRSFQQVWNENIWITTSGMFSLAPLACLLQTTSIDRVLYSVDYPFSTTETGLEFFKKIESSGLIKGEDLEKFAFGNAEALLKVKARNS